MKRILWVLAMLVLATNAYAQSGSVVKQSGNVTPGHLPYWVTNGVVADAGTSADSPLTSLGVTSNSGAGFCVSSARSTAPGRQQLCFGAPLNGPAVISLQNYGTATPQGLNFIVNGVTLTLPTVGGDFVTGQGPYVSGNVPCFAASTAIIQDCGMAMTTAGVVTGGTWQGTPVAVAFGGTGSTSQSGARTGLGLGTISTQNANAVAITGGTITGMPSPSSASDVANKSYVDGVVTGLNILAPSTLATAAVLPNTPTYSNGTLGVGATLTAGSNTTLTVDGTVATLNTVVLVKNQASAFQNGIYTVTTAGGGVPWVLTRATYFDQAAEMKAGSYTFITGGATNPFTSWTLQTAVTTVGSDSLTFVLFSSTTTGVTSATIAAGTGISVSGTCTVTSTGTCTVSSAPTAPPQGRLTLQSGTPVMAVSQSLKSTIYYDCNGGNVVPYYNGSTDVYDTVSSCEVSTDMVATAGPGQTVSGQVYDIWWVHGGANRLCIAMSSVSGGGGGWAFDTGGTAQQRGTGYTQLDFQSRPYVTNKNSITNCYNGSSNYGPVSVNQATYLGTVYAVANGLTSHQFGSINSGGAQAGIFGLWNMYNRQTINSVVQDSTGSWTFGAASAWRPANNSTGNSFTYVIGVPSDGVQAIYKTLVLPPFTPLGSWGQIGVCFDCTNGANSTSFLYNNSNVASSYSMGIASWAAVGQAGVHVVYATEYSAYNSVTFWGVTHGNLTINMRL